MKKIINSIVIIFTLIITTFIANAEVVKPDAVYSFIRHEYILNEDGSMIYNYEHGLKLLTSFAVNRLHGESFITYNPDWQTLEVTKSKTIMADGQKVNSPFNAFNEVLPRSVANAAPYMNLREMVVTHTGLERKCEINFAYTLTSKAGFLPGFLGKIIIGAHDPIKNFDIILKVPKDTKLNLFMSNQGPLGDKFTKDNFDIYYWKIKDLPLIPIEKGQPAIEEFMPTLYFSTATNSDIVRHILTQEDIFSLSDNTKNIIKKLIEDKFTFTEKVFALRDYVYSNVGNANIKPRYLGYKVLKAQETFSRNVGSHPDRAVLLTAMCRAVGIDADIALTPVYPEAKSDLSLLGQFGEFLVYCKPDVESDIPILLDPNHTQTKILPSIVANKLVFVLNPKKLYLIPAVQKNSSSSFFASFDFSKNKIKGSGKVSLSGNYLPALESKDCDKIIDRHFKKSGWDVEPSDNNKIISNINSYTKNISIKKDGINKLDGIYELNLPTAPRGFDALNIKLIPVSRITPYKLPQTFDEEYQFTVNIPEDMSLTVDVKDIEIENLVGKVLNSIRQEGNKLIISRKLKINKDLINPEEYHHLYKLISGWNSNKHKTIYIK
ncbi:DUF3857 domain-containing protein [Bacteroidota bacterium]